MKVRSLDSPDDGDALALTFAAPVTAVQLALAAGESRSLSHNDSVDGSHDLVDAITNCD
jgi:hypothetical protein